MYLNTKGLYLTSVRKEWNEWTDDNGLVHPSGVSQKLQFLIDDNVYEFPISPTDNVALKPLVLYQLTIDLLFRNDKPFAWKLSDITPYKEE